MQLIAFLFRRIEAVGGREEKEVMSMDKGPAISLYEGERILWQGKPGCSWRKLVKPSDILKVPIGLLFFLFALCWEGAALSVPGLWGIALIRPAFYSGRSVWQRRPLGPSPLASAADCLRADERADSYGVPQPPGLPILSYPAVFGEAGKRRRVGDDSFRQTPCRLA